MRKAILYIVCFPNDLGMFVFLLFVRLFWGSGFVKNHGLWVLLKNDSWLDRTWGSKYDGLCLGHGGVLSSSHTATTIVHELVHSEQHEVAMFKSLFIASVASAICAIFNLYQIIPYFFLCIWPLGYLSYLICSWFVAFLRDEDVYKGSSHEEAAYAIAEDYLRRKEGLNDTRRVLK